MRSVDCLLVSSVARKGQNLEDLEVEVLEVDNRTIGAKDRASFWNLRLVLERRDFYVFGTHSTLR